MGTEPRIALVDIETAPLEGLCWGIWEQNVIEVTKPWYLLSFSMKWLDKKRIHTYALPDFPGYKPGSGDDKTLVKCLWKVFDEADFIIAHNGNRFDIRKANARFVEHGLNPPTPYKSIDTLVMARRTFKFDSNKLDSLGQYLGVGRKMPHTGKALWLGCMAGDPKSWATMKRYNAQDVALLERVYLKLRAWSPTHPALTHISRAGGCPTCQSQNVQFRGFSVTRTGKRPRRHCQSCGAWSVGDQFIREVA